MLMFPQALNINNLRSTGTKSIKFETIKKFVECSSKIFSIKAMFALTVFEILLLKCRLVLSPAQENFWSQRVQVSVKNQK